MPELTSLTRSADRFLGAARALADEDVLAWPSGRGDGTALDTGAGGLPVLPPLAYRYT